MTLCISHQTAFNFWRMPGNHPHKFQKAPCNIVESFRTTKSLLAKILASEFFGADSFDTSQGTIHFLVHEKNERRFCSGTKVHTISMFDITTDYYWITDGVVVPSPETVFVQMASSGDFTATLNVGCELCSSFALAKQPKNNVVDKDLIENSNNSSNELLANMNNSYAKLVQIQPVTNAQLIVEYCNSVKNLRGIQNARRVAEILPKGNAASPMEIKLFQILCSPRNKGGFGISVPQFNYGVLLGNKASNIYRHKKCICDLCWPEFKIDLEYDSDLVHAFAKKIHSDANRRLALEEDGYRVITVTKNHVYDKLFMERIAKKIMSYQGKNLRIRRDGFVEAQDSLFRDLGLRA